MTLQFTKMHGLGNDFMVIDAVSTPMEPATLPIAALARRDTGIGFDQCLVVEPSHSPDIDFFYRIFNADGNEVGQCGNGARCLARFLHYRKLTNKTTLTVATRTTRMTLQLNPDDSVTVNMGVPQFEPSAIPLLADKARPTYTLPLDQGQSCEVHALSLGNPHALLLVDSVLTADVSGLGRQIATHPIFPEGTNAGFMECVGNQRIRLRVHERGAGETRACGSNAAASAVIGRLYYGMQAHITIALPGGELQADWEGPGDPLFLTGPATFVYEGALLSSRL